MREALRNHLVFVFRDQNLLAQQLVNLGKNFGELRANPFVPSGDVTVIPPANN